MNEIALNSIGQLYEILGDAKIRELVDLFYDVMDRESFANDIRKLHPESLTESRDKLYWFLVGRFGGPPLYAEQRGNPMLRARHNPFPIGDAERDAWLACMHGAIEKSIPDEKVRALLTEFFKMVADSMRNKFD